MVAELLHELRKAGLTISILHKSLLIVEPKDRITDELRERIKMFKPELIKILSVPPGPCANCPQLEVLSIAGNPVAGCVQKLETGHWAEEWHRLPPELQKCVFH
jgi:hypothetical protein